MNGEGNRDQGKAAAVITTEQSHAPKRRRGRQVYFGKGGEAALPLLGELKEIRGPKADVQRRRICEKRPGGEKFRSTLYQALRKKRGQGGIMPRTNR